jgi:hypothetical protein
MVRTLRNGGSRRHTRGFSIAAAIGDAGLAAGCTSAVFIVVFGQSHDHEPRGRIGSSRIQTQQGANEERAVELYHLNQVQRFRQMGERTTTPQRTAHCNDGRIGWW